MGDQNEEKSSKPFKLIIDQRPYEWNQQFITGSQIKQLAGVDSSYGVWQQLPGPDDPEISDSQQIDLGLPGRERFFTGKKATTEGLRLYVVSAGK